MSFHLCIPFISLADDEEDKDDLTHSGNGKNGNLKSEQNREMSEADAMTDAETNYDDSKTKNAVCSSITVACVHDDNGDDRFGHSFLAKIYEPFPIGGRFMHSSSGKVPMFLWREFLGN